MPSRYNYSAIVGGMSNRWGYDKINLMPICPICKTKLIPIYHGVVNPEILEIHHAGKILIGSNKDKGLNSYCPLCEEAYGDFTDTPAI